MLNIYDRLNLDRREHDESLLVAQVIVKASGAKVAMMVPNVFR